jgi:hypothetical protein
VELKRAFGVQRDAVTRPQADRHPVAIGGRLHFKGARVRLAV